MNRYFGVALLVIGVVLLVFGLDASNSVASRLSRFFTGTFTDRTTWYLVGGIAALLVGASMTFYRRGQRA